MYKNILWRNVVHMNKDFLSMEISHKPVFIHRNLFILKCAVDPRKKEETGQCRNQHFYSVWLYAACVGTLSNPFY